MRAPKSPFQSYMSEQILSFAYLMCPSVSRPKALKKQCLRFAYRIYSNKRRRAYLIFRATSAALIRGRPLFEGGAYLKIVPDKFTFNIYLFNGTLSICL